MSAGMRRGVWEVERPNAWETVVAGRTRETVSRDRGQMQRLGLMLGVCRRRRALLLHAHGGALQLCGDVVRVGRSAARRGVRRRFAVLRRCNALYHMAAGSGWSTGWREGSRAEQSRVVLGAAAKARALVLALALGLGETGRWTGGNGALLI